MRCSKNFIYSMSCLFMRTLIIFLLLIVSQTNLAFRIHGHRRHSWESPGCTKVAHTRPVKIPNCVQFRVTTNACRGFCVSYAIPSSDQTLASNPSLEITSRAECCSILQTFDVTIRVWCIGGFRNVTFKSASECGCSICRHG
ncbi:hypothetical protein SNE40_010101 [Patella caerulea]|uniref:DAN domain-containing protein n=1 Tax=Patella caerulea TaxID=87958 RepID=A0AAN8PSH1_PATCE